MHDRLQNQAGIHIIMRIVDCTGGFILQAQLCHDNPLDAPGYYPEIQQQQLMTNPTKKSSTRALIPVFAVSLLALPVCKGAVVFSDDFSEAPGTLIAGKNPDVGGAWTGSAGSPAITISAANTLNTAGDARTLYGSFAAALGAGEKLTLTYDTLNFNGTFNGYAGVSLYTGGAGGTEQVFTGCLGNYNSWGVDGAALGNIPASPENTAGATSATFTYAYDTGAWSMTTLAGVNLSGVGTAHLALDTLRIANGNGGDINLDNLVVGISAVPEPTSLALFGTGMGLLLLLRRQRAS